MPRRLITSAGNLARRRSASAVPAGGEVAAFSWQRRSARDNIVGANMSDCGCRAVAAQTLTVSASA